MADRTEAGRAADLDRRLDAYEAQARAGAGCGRPARWPAYAAAVGSSLALATAADAEIIFSGVQNVTVTRPSNSAAGTFTNVKTFKVGGATFQLSAARFNVRPFSTSTDGVFLKPLAAGAAFRAQGSNVKKFSSGAAISANGLFVGSTFGIVRQLTHLTTFPPNTFGSFPASGSGFAGIKFHKSDGDHFGWIRLLVTSGVHGGEDNNQPETLTAVDWAFENVPGAPIPAGQTTGGVGVPEPTSLALMLLAAGSAGVLAWRNRRKPAPEAG